MTLANRITLFRILLIPVFSILCLQESKYPVLTNWTLAVFAFAILTDFLDGMVARSRKQKTLVGSFMDPLADKLLILASFTLLTYAGKVALWVLVTIFFRDLIIVLGWTIIYILTSRATVEPRWLGKASTFFQMTAAIALLFPMPFEVRIWLVRVMVLVTVASAVDYIAVYSKKLEPIPH
jgi:CDP-diacylglycerol--glycerol-3-phosphate 3-phosphatidyltransferase